MSGGLFYKSIHVKFSTSLRVLCLLAHSLVFAVGCRSPRRRPPACSTTPSRPTPQPPSFPTPRCCLPLPSHVSLLPPSSSRTLSSSSSRSRWDFPDSNGRICSGTARSAEGWPSEARRMRDAWCGRAHQHRLSLYVATQGELLLPKQKRHLSHRYGLILLLSAHQRCRERKNIHSD